MLFDKQRDSINVAVVSPHPDDETLGAGGTIARHAALGDEIHVCVVTKGYEPDWQRESLELIREQTNEALKVLGVLDAEFLGFPTVKLNTVPMKELTDSIAGFIKGVEPQVVYAPFPGDLNSDHGIVARSTAIAVRPTPGSRMSLLYYETLSSTEWGRIFLHSGFKPNLYVDIESVLDRKLAAAKSYDSEMRQFPHPRSVEGIEALARTRGMEVGLNAAEAFSLAIHIA